MHIVLPSHHLVAISPAFMRLGESGNPVRLFTLEDKLIIATWTSNLRLGVAIPVEVVEPGAAVVNLSKFFACSTAQKDTVLMIKSDPANTRIETESVRATLPSYDPAMFIQVPTFKDETLQAKIPSNDLVHAFALAQPCANNSGIAMWEDSFLIECNGDKGVIVASDRSHMCAVHFPCEGDSFKCCIPQPLFMNCIDLANELVSIKYDGNLIEFNTPYISIQSNILSSMMPAVLPVIAPLREQAIHSSTLDYAAITGALSLASKLCSDSNTAYAYLDLDQDSCRLRVNDQDRHDVVNANLDSTATSACKIYFDHDKLGRVLRNLHKHKVVNDTVTIRYNSPTTPLFVDLGHSTTDLYCLMPKRPPQLSK